MFCDVVSVSLCEVVSDVLDVSDEVSDGVSVADVVSVSLDVSVLSVAFGVDFTSLPSEVTVLVLTRRLKLQESPNLSANCLVINSRQAILKLRKKNTENIVVP